MYECQIGAKLIRFDNTAYHNKNSRSRRLKNHLNSQNLKPIHINDDIQWLSPHKVQFRLTRLESESISSPNPDDTEETYVTNWLANKLGPTKVGDYKLSLTNRSKHIRPSYITPNDLP